MENSQKKQAQITCLRLLAASPKSRLELTKRLGEKGYPEAIIQETLNSLESQGLLSDAAYAQNIVSKFTLAKPSGSRKIGFELKRKGIPAQIREEALAKLNPADELSRAKELAEYQWLKAGKLAPLKRSKKVYDFLIRRGFDFQTAKEVLKELEKNPVYDES